jgi:threonine/homoserine/homoserine lactone efflux protein
MLILNALNSTKNILTNMHIIDSLWLFVLVTMASVATPGPAVLLALRNGGSYGTQSAMWSSLGNVLGLLVISGLSAWGLSAVLMTSSWLFLLVKICGGIYLAYIGTKLLFPQFFYRKPKAKRLKQNADVRQTESVNQIGPIDQVSQLDHAAQAIRASLAIQLDQVGQVGQADQATQATQATHVLEAPHKVSPSAYTLTRQGMLVALSNPKPIFFFSALFPQFLNPYDPLVMQFVVLTTVFVLISFTGLMIYAVIASRTRVVLGASRVAVWLKRFAGLLFLGMAFMLIGWKPSDGK